MKILSRFIAIISGFFTAAFLAAAHAVAQGMNQNSMIEYAPPEVFNCGVNNFCLFFYRNTKILISAIIVIVLLIIFFIVRFIKKRRNQNAQEQITTDETPKQ